MANVYDAIAIAAGVLTNRRMQAANYNITFHVKLRWKKINLSIGLKPDFSIQI